LSQGGKGHVPLLLWLRELAPVDPDNDSDYDTLFLGTFTSHYLRKGMVEVIQKIFPTTSFVRWRKRKWLDFYRRSKTIMCPRGYGRNSYRLGEVLQLGMIPIYVYSDFVWLPYYDSINWSSFAYVAHINELENVLLKMRRELTMEKVAVMRQKVRSLRATHWTGDGVVTQIMNLLKWGFAVSDLRCGNYSKSRDVSIIIPNCLNSTNSTAVHRK
jgi:hypothetical protein